MDSRDRRAERDRARINIGEAYEVEYWSKTLDVSKERLTAIIAKVGDRVADIRREIAEQNARKPED